MLILRQYFIYLFVAFFLTVTLSCAPLNQQSLANIPLLPVELLNQNRQVTQVVTIVPLKTGLVDTVKSVPEFITAWSVQDKQLTVVGLTSTGQLLMRLHYANEQLTETYSPLINHPIPGREILSQIQLTHWPLHAIKHAFDKTQWQVVDKDGKRKIYLSKKLALEIINPAEDTPSTLNGAIIYNYLNGYNLQIKTLTTTDL